MNLHNYATWFEEHSIERILNQRLDVKSYENPLSPIGAISFTFETPSSCRVNPHLLSRNVGKGLAPVQDKPKRFSSNSC